LAERLEQEPRPDWSRIGDPLEQLDAMAVPRKKQRRCRARGSRADHRDSHGIHGGPRAGLWVGQIERSPPVTRLDHLMSAMLGGVVTDVRWHRSSARSFEELVELRLDACYRLAAVLLGDRLEAEDATHDAILKAQRSWSTVRDQAAAPAWLDRIVVNECRDRLRRRRVARTIAAAERPDHDPAGPLDDAFSAERAALRDALAELGPDHRLVVVLRYLADLSIDAIATRTGTPPGTVKSRLHHALRLLRAAYEAGARR
jgi:RNA polymerase sigma-70 factor (ECF subfamily)